MRNFKILFTATLIALLINLPQTQNRSALNQEVTIQSRVLDNRAQILQAYLAKYNSPLRYHAQDFIDAADTYNMDWKLVPAISGVESTFGKNIPGGYNGWGWGVYGDQAIYFDSWREAIFTVSAGLKQNYIDNGLTTPHSMNRKYAANSSWGNNVNYFLGDINKFIKESEIAPWVDIKTIDTQPQQAGSSAKLTHNVSNLALNIQF